VNRVEMKATEMWGLYGPEGRLIVVRGDKLSAIDAGWQKSWSPDAYDKLPDGYRCVPVTVTVKG